MLKMATEIKPLTFSTFKLKRGNGRKTIICLNSLTVLPLTWYSFEVLQLYSIRLPFEWLSSICGIFLSVIRTILYFHFVHTKHSTYHVQYNILNCWVRLYLLYSSLLRIFMLFVSFFQLLEGFRWLAKGQKKLSCVTIAT